MKEILASSWLILLAVAFQIYLTPNIGGWEIRLSAVDLLIPIFIISILVNHKKIKIEWRNEETVTWLIALTLLIIISFLNGFVLNERISTTSLINKFFGWFVLMGYFFAGAITFGCLYRLHEATFVRLLMICALVVGIFDFIPFWATFFGASTRYWRMEGFSGNPNAYGYLLVLIVCLGLSWFCNKAIKRIRGVDLIMIGALISFIFFSGSRSSWLGLIFALSYLIAFGNLNQRAFFKVLVVSGLIFAVTYGLPRIDFEIKAANIEYRAADTEHIKPYIANHDLTNDSGSKQRIELLVNAYELWSEHPLFGSGIGGFQIYQTKQNQLLSIHSTYLWVLVEMGLIGFLLFTGFFYHCIYWLFLYRNSECKDVTRIAGLAIIMVFIGASIGMDVMYQRLFWFILGWVMVTKSC